LFCMLAKGFTRLTGEVTRNSRMGGGWKGAPKGRKIEM